jgi:hypothetical protein
MMFRASTTITSNRPVDDWGKLLGDSAAVTAMLDRLLWWQACFCAPTAWAAFQNVPMMQAAG